MALDISGDGRRTAPPRPVAKPKDEPRSSKPRTVAEALSSASTGVGVSDRPRTTIPQWNIPRMDGVTHPPALAPRSKEAVQAYNQPIADAAERKAQTDRTAGMYQAMADRQQRAEARAAREKADRKESAQALTPDEWRKLDPRQQAAVQANADLAAAIALDIKTQGKAKNQGDDGTRRVKDYMDRVTELFGEDGSVGFKGIEFAPNTVAFLEQRGLDKDALGGRTLDDLVSGDTLFTMDQIEQLGRRHSGREASTDQMFKTIPSDTAFLERLAAGQLQYQEDLANKLARGNQLLTGMTSARTNRAAGDSYGAPQVETRYDAIQPQTMELIDQYMLALAHPKSAPDEALGAINLDLQQRGVSGREAEQVFQLLSERSNQGATGEGKWFDGIDFPVRNPVEVAQMLGSPALKRLSMSGQAAAARDGG